MLTKLLFALSLTISPVVSVSAQVENTDFDTYQSAEKYLEDFDYLNEYNYRLSTTTTTTTGNAYLYKPYIYYAFSNYYDITISGNFYNYYSNDNYNFFFNTQQTYEVQANFSISNYIGEETIFYFFALDNIGMNQVMEHDKEVKSNNISIYSSFFKFFTGFFPTEVVAEYHGIFTFVVVAFLFFLVFGFIFFLFRTIRRLMGYK